MRNEVDYKALGLRIKEVRQRKGMTQDFLAEAVGCNTSHISNIENNYTKPSLNVLLAIANTLQTSIDYLLSNQYQGSNDALDKEILQAVHCVETKQKDTILRIIEILKG